MGAAAPGRSSPAPVPDTGTGPAPVAGRVDELAPGLVRVTAPNPGVMTGPGTNTYLVGTGEVAVVDPGPDDPAHLRRVEEAVERAGGSIRWVLVTHTHPDHAPGAVPLARRAGATLVGYGARDGFVPDVAAGDGWELAAPSFRLRALHMPGHASDHLCWLLVEQRICLSGDHVMHGATVVIRPPDGDMAAYLSSLERLGSLDPPLRAIAPGHGRLIGDPGTVVAGIVAHRLEREALVARALRDAGTATIDQLVGTVYADVDPTLLPIARHSLWAHLRKLAGDGLAAPLGGAGAERAAADALVGALAWTWTTAPEDTAGSRSGPGAGTGPGTRR